jgi:hypothetical protein
MSTEPQPKEKNEEEEVEEDYDPEGEVVGNWKICDLP